ncbi:hypothetical protein RBSWK_03724 [Rhodopirellula baltica SWK14]|uniref:Uncharacterized protein n=2 Tax=Rhodopirellula baltica TaxID=265606 RepID=L7CE99_RHOBT|nr:hypothetical protein RBSWK_03724 [Rhodopirellula baltica SWK14]
MKEVAELIEQQRQGKRVSQDAAQWTNQRIHVSRRVELLEVVRRSRRVLI